MSTTQPRTHTPQPLPFQQLLSRRISCSEYLTLNNFQRLRHNRLKRRRRVRKETQIFNAHDIQYLHHILRLVYLFDDSTAFRPVMRGVSGQDWIIILYSRL